MLPRPNKPDVSNPAITPRFQIGHPQRGVADRERATHVGIFPIAPLVRDFQKPIDRIVAEPNSRS